VGSTLTFDWEVSADGIWQVVDAVVIYGVFAVDSGELHGGCQERIEGVCKEVMIPAWLSWRVLRVGLAAGPNSGYPLLQKTGSQTIYL